MERSSETRFRSVEGASTRAWSVAHACSSDGSTATSRRTVRPARSYLDGVRRLTTSGVPVNLTTGTNADTSDVFTGDFSKLYVGVRTELTITVLSERYMQEEGSYGLVAWYRGDIGVARPRAFVIVRGIRV